MVVCRARACIGEEDIDLEGGREFRSGGAMVDRTPGRWYMRKKELGQATAYRTGDGYELWSEGSSGQVTMMMLGE